MSDGAVQYFDAVATADERVVVAALDRHGLSPRRSWQLIKTWTSSCVARVWTHTST